MRNVYWLLAAVLWGFAGGIGMGAALRVMGLWPVVVVGLLAVMGTGWLVVLAWRVDERQKRGL